jgi:hypothetical protein
MYYENSLTEQVHDEDGKSGPFGWERGEINLQSGYFINNWKESDYSNKSWYMCSTPTQSLLKKWLREVHNLDVDSKLNTHLFRKLFEAGHKKKSLNYHWVITTNINDEEFFFESFVSDTTYLTYEEALEKGLHESLKLIQ